MRSALSIIALVAACGGSEPAPQPAPKSNYLPSQAAEDNTPRERPAPPPRPQPPVAESHPPPAKKIPREPEPPPPVDGVYSPLYLRARGTDVLDQRIKVKGTVVWIYDCVADVAAQQPDKSRDEIEKLVVKKPDLCKRPHFFLGDKKSTPKERAIQVVEVPRPLRRDERISMPKEQVDAWPEVPSLAVGQQITVEGKWALNSPKGWANADGLLVYGRLVP
jgi:hypothetical protein